MATRKSFAGAGFSADHGAGYDRTRCRSGGGSEHRVHRRAAGGIHQLTHHAGTASAVVLRRGCYRFGRRRGYFT